MIGRRRWPLYLVGKIFLRIGWQLLGIIQSARQILDGVRHLEVMLWLESRWKFHAPPPCLACASERHQHGTEPVRTDPLVSSMRRVGAIDGRERFSWVCSSNGVSCRSFVCAPFWCFRLSAPQRAFRSASYRKGVLKVSDARISLIGEIVDGIKTVKLNSLDAKFRSRVEALRAKELASIRQALTLNAYNQVKPVMLMTAMWMAGCSDDGYDNV